MIDIRHISKSFPSGSGTVKVLDDVSLTIKKGDAVCITGKSGSGKTTLLDIITTILTPTDGQYLFQEKDIKDYNNDDLAQLRNEHFGFVFQAFYLLENMTVLENICLPFSYSKKAAPDINHISKLLTELEISDLAKRMPRQLSGGQKQRVAIARALANSPSVIVADEPTGNLDQETGEKVLNLLFHFQKQGTTLVLVTHDRDIASRFPRVFSLEDGAISENKNV